VCRSLAGNTFVSSVDAVALRRRHVVGTDRPTAFPLVIATRRRVDARASVA
jgi:hypothetical protein